MIASDNKSSWLFLPRLGLFSRITILLFHQLIIALITNGQQNTSLFQINFSFPSLKTASNIRDIEQDKLGFLWIATQDGLYRYDSKNVDRYNTQYNGNRLIFSSDVRSLLIDSINNTVWAISSGGNLHAIDLSTGNVYFKKNVNESNNTDEIFFSKIINLKDTIVLASNKGLYFYLKKEKRFDKISDIELSSLDIDEITIIENNLVLFAKNKGIFQYNLKEHEKVTFIDYNTIFPNQNCRFYNAVVSNNNVYFASNTNINKISFVNGKATLDNSFLNFIPNNYRSNTFSVCLDKSNKLWFSNENQLIKVDLINKSYTIIQNAIYSNEDLLNNIYNLYCDVENNIWLGCQQGIAMVKNKDVLFRSISKSNVKNITIKHTYFINPITDSTIYACAENGLYFIDVLNKVINVIDDSKAYDYIFKDPYNRMLVSNTEGFFELHRGKLFPINKIYKEFDKLGRIRFNSSIVLNDSCIAFGTENYKGIIIWNFVSHAIQQYDNSSKNSIRLNENVTNTVKYLSPNKFALLGDANFGLIDYTLKKYTPIKIIGTEKKYSLFFDLCKIKNRYFLACYGYGVVELDENFKVVNEISTNNGLSNNGVYKVLPWKDSLLFITTNNGLNVYNINTNKIKQYYKSDGLHGDAFEETSGSFFSDKIYAGGEGGLSIIYPNNLATNSSPPIFYFNKLSLELINKQKLDTVNFLAKKYYIPNNTIQTTISFSAINYSNPERTTFNYRITEQSKEWIDLGTQNFVTLIGLSPGTYHLQVKAANEDGVWCEPKELVLEFLPKWYQTWWFKLLIALTTFGIIYAFYRYRIRQIKKQHQIRKNIATDLHDDLGSTLNSVKVFTNLAISGVNQNESLQQIKQNLNEATLGLRDMIWVLDDGLDTTDELATRIKQYAIPVGNAAGIDVQVTCTHEAGQLILTKEEKRNLFLICKEAINNAIKYSQASLITVQINSVGKKLNITITDNGKGFDIDKVNKGYGLKNMEYRARQIKYTTKIDNLKNKGTYIQISPL